MNEKSDHINKMSVFILVALFTIVMHSNAQVERTPLIEVSFDAISDVMYINQGVAPSQKGKTMYLGLEQIGISINPFRKTTSNTFIHLNILNTHGARPSEDYIGDLQVISNIEAGNYFGLFEVYIEQHMGNHTVKIGQHDLNASFLFVDSALPFSNSSFGIMPSVSGNMCCSIFPMAAPGIIYQFKHKTMSFQLGVYDGYPEEIGANKHNLNPVLSGNEGALSIFEGQYSLDQDQSTFFKVGAVYHSADFTMDDISPKIYKGNYSSYLLLQHSFGLDAGYDKKYTIFLKGGMAPADRNYISAFSGSGMIVNSCLPFVRNDQLGLAMARAELSHLVTNDNDSFAHAEHTFELFYGFDVLKHFRFQPSVQYIVNPGALKSNPNVLVSGFRMAFSL